VRAAHYAGGAGACGILRKEYKDEKKTSIVIELRLQLPKSETYA